MFQGSDRDGNGGSGAVTSLLERPRGRAEDDRDFGPELDVLRLGSEARLSALLPRMRFDLRNEPTVVVDLVDGVPATEHRSGGVLDPEVAAAIGASLGAWHAGAAEHADRFRIAPDTPPRGLVARDPLLGAVLAAVAAGWTTSTVIHGDCRSANASVTLPPSGCGSARVVLTSWNRSGRGDPAWDLGCLLADLFASAHAEDRAAAAEPAVSAAVAAYGRTSGAAGDVELPGRVARCMVARLVGLGLEEHDPRALELARSMAAWLPTWTRRFALWLG
jgi:hypothetical protein